MIQKNATYLCSVFVCIHSVIPLNYVVVNKGFGEMCFLDKIEVGEVFYARLAALSCTVLRVARASPWAEL